MTTTIEDAFRLVAHEPCLICGTGAGDMVTVVFVANDDGQVRIGAAKGRMRITYYRLCGPCSSRPDKADVAEGLIWERLGL